MTSDSGLSTPQARRRANTNARLREALGALAKDPSAAPTVAGLARAAGVGRNIIYTHHADVLDALRELQSQREGATEMAAGDADVACQFHLAAGQVELSACLKPKACSKSSALSPETISMNL